MKKKNNFLPLLLVGGGVGAAVLLFSKASSKTKEDTNMFTGGGIGGSGDFFGNSTPVSSIPVIDPMLYPDSMDAGIEDIARNDTNLGLTDTSSGGVNPTNYSTDGTDIWSDLALNVGVTAATTAALGGVSAAAKTVAGKTASKAATNAAGTAAGRVAGSTAGKLLGKAGLAGLGISAIGTALEVTGMQDVINNFGVTLPMVNPAAAIGANVASNLVMGNFSVGNSGITTDKATSQEVGYMAYDNKQLQTANGLQRTGSKWETISAEETRIVNEALGTTGDVIKQSYGSSGYSYIGAGGKQLTFAGTDLQTAAGLYKQHNAGKR